MAIKEWESCQRARCDNHRGSEETRERTHAPSQKKPAAGSAHLHVLHNLRVVLWVTQLLDINSILQHHDAAGIAQAWHTQPRHTTQAWDAQARQHHTRQAHTHVQTTSTTLALHVRRSRHTQTVSATTIRAVLLHDSLLRLLLLLVDGCRLLGGREVGGCGALAHAGTPGQAREPALDTRHAPRCLPAAPPHLCCAAHCECSVPHLEAVESRTRDVHHVGVKVHHKPIPAGTAAEGHTHTHTGEKEEVREGQQTAGATGSSQHAYAQQTPFLKPPWLTSTPPRCSAGSHAHHPLTPCCCRSPCL